MNNAWRSYHARMNTIGQTKRDMMLQHARSSISRRLVDSLAYHTVLIDQIEREVGIINKADLDTKTIVAMPGEKLVHGGLVEYENHKWLITELDVSNEVYERGLMRQCNYILKWTDASGNIIEKWCIVEDGTKYLTGERSEQMMTIGDARISVTIAKDADTAKIVRGKRFLIDDPTASSIHAYQVTKLNRLFNLYNDRGVYRFILIEDHLTKNDNTELMIADYYSEETSGADESVQHGGGWL